MAKVLLWMLASICLVGCDDTPPQVCVSGLVGNCYIHDSVCQACCPQLPATGMKCSLSGIACTYEFSAYFCGDDGVLQCTGGSCESPRDLSAVVDLATSGG